MKQITDLIFHTHEKHVPAMGLACFADMGRDKWSKENVEQVRNITLLPCLDTYLSQKDITTYFRFLNRLWAGSSGLPKITYNNMFTGITFNTMKLSGQELVFAGSLIRAVWEDGKFVESIVRMQVDNLLSTLSPAEQLTLAQAVYIDDTGGHFFYSHAAHSACGMNTTREAKKNLDNWDAWFSQYKPYNEVRKYGGRDHILGFNGHYAAKDEEAYFFYGAVLKENKCSDRYKLTKLTFDSAALYGYVKAFYGV